MVGRRPPKMYNLTLGLLYRNQAHALAEWIQFHRNVGVDRIVLYDHLSEDNSTLVARVFARKLGFHDVITLDTKDWHPNPTNSKNRDRVQADMYTHCVTHYGADTRFMGIWDMDEFVYPINNTTLYGLLNEQARAQQAKFLVPSGGYYFELFRFSTGGSLIVHQYSLNRDGPGSEARLCNPCGPQLFTNRILRGPSGSFRSPHESALHATLLKDPEKCPNTPGWNVCYEGMGKSAVLPHAVVSWGHGGNMHMVEVAGPPRYSMDPLLQGRGNHHYLRSMEGWASLLCLYLSFRTYLAINVLSKKKA